MAMVTAKDIRKFAGDPLAFIEALRLPGSGAQFGDVMAPFQVEWFKTVVPSLLAVAAGKKPPVGRLWTERTKGGSKDTDAAACILWLLAFSSRPVLVQVGADDSDQASEIRKVCDGILQSNPWLQSRVTVVRWRVECDATRSACDILTSDASSSHGARPDVLVLNELSHIGSRDFAETLMDNLTKMPNGLGIIATNAGFTGTWQAEWREIAATSPRWRFQSVAEPAPWLNADDLAEAARRNPPGRYRRLYRGVWVPLGEGDAVDDSWITRAVCLTSPPEPSKSYPDPNGWIYGAGLDAGLRHDSTGIVVLRARPGSKVQLCDTWVRSPRKGETIPIAEIVAKVRELHGRWHLDSLVIDPWQMIGAGQELAAAGIPVRECPATAASQRQQAEALLRGFREGLVELYDDGRLPQDLRAASIEETGNLGGMRIAWPRTAAGHCDLGAAFALLLPLALNTLNIESLIVEPPRLETVLLL